MHDPVSQDYLTGEAPPPVDLRPHVVAYLANNLRTNGYEHHARTMEALADLRASDKPSDADLYACFAADLGPGGAWVLDGARTVLARYGHAARQASPTAIDTRKLRELRARATPGPLLLATSNSWRRIVSFLGSKPVCEPRTQPDGHPDLHFPNGGAEGPDATLLIEAWNVQPALLDEIDALRAEKERTERNRDMWQGQCERQAKQLQATRWQPIETAPTTGRTLLLGYCNSLGKWRTVRGQWMSKDYIAQYWEDPGDPEPGWFETSVESDEIPNCWRIEPTHWMPLPPAPPQGEGA